MQLLRRRTAIEYAVVAYEVFMLSVAASSFLSNPNTEVLQTFSNDLHIPLTNDMFAIGCALGVLVSLSVMLFSSNGTKRYLYIVAVSPLIAYTAPVGYWAYANQRPGLGPIVYVAIYLAFVLLAFATFREDGGDKSTVNVPANRDANAS